MPSNTISRTMRKQSGAARDAVREQARIELGLEKRFLDEGNFGAFTTTFENLHGLKQLPGLAAQRLMEQGYGFAGEGDWKTAALVRVMKTMASGQSAGTSFMEDYTYHLESGQRDGVGRAYAGNLPQHCGDEAAYRSASAGHRRQSRPGAFGFRWRKRASN